MVITGVGLVCSIFKHHIFFLLVFSHSTLSLTILLYPGTFKQAFVAFRNKNVYKGKKIGFEFRGGLEKAPPSVLLRLAEEYKNQDTKKWEKTFPWQHPLFIQRVIQNLNLIGEKGLQAHVKIEVLSDLYQNAGECTPFKCKSKLLKRLNDAATTDVRKALIAENIKKHDDTIAEYAKKAEKIIQQHNDQTTLNDASKWISKGGRIVSPSWFAYSETDPKYQEHCGDGKCIKWTGGAVNDNEFVRNQNRWYYPREMVVFTLKVIVAEKLWKVNKLCSKSVNQDDKNIIVHSTPEDIFELIEDTDHGLNDCLSDLWMRWSFAFQVSEWEKKFKNPGVAPTTLTLQDHKVVDLDRSLVTKLVWKNKQFVECKGENCWKLMVSHGITLAPLAELRELVL